MPDRCEKCGAPAVETITYPGGDEVAPATYKLCSEHARAARDWAAELGVYL